MLETILNYLRIALYASLMIVGFFLIQAWQKDHPKPVLPVEQVETAPPNEGRYVPAAPNTAAQAAPVSTSSPSASSVPVSTAGSLIHVTTDVMQASIDTRGGDVVNIRLLKYPESLGSHTPFLLLNDNDNTRYIAESGLLSSSGPDTTQGQALYTSPKMEYALGEGENALVVKLSWQHDGLKVAKIFTFARNSYEIHVGYEIDNHTQSPWQGSLYTQLMRTNTPPAGSGGFVNLATYFGAAISSPQKPFEKISFKQMQNTNLNETTPGGWAAMIQHYFISAWIPPSMAVSNYYSRVTPSGLYTIGMIGQPMTAAPGTHVATEAKLYAGPAISESLEKAASGLKLTIDYGWFWFISAIIFWMMQKIYDVVGNWGWSIVIVTIIIKLIFYQLSAKSYRSMSALKRLQPKMEMLKERYSDDRQKLTQATMELYRQEKVNPMSGCLPILIQIPVFIALYWVLVESVQLRQAPFIFWIHDLSRQDPYYILPILMGISMFIQQRLNPAPADPMQAKMMMLMPFIFTVLFANFPAGLMLYWFVNNTLSFLQQWFIMRKINHESKSRT